ncbi:hypothetical protein HDU83_001959 [Entophlyctis luteolus]|nr:hypothetical protein HDU83_001959 [Entophlyctis luteolus]
MLISSSTFYSSSSPSFSSSATPFNMSYIIGATAGVLVCVLAAFAALLLAKRRRMHPSDNDDQKDLVGGAASIAGRYSYLSKRDSQPPQYAQEDLIGMYANMNEPSMSGAAEGIGMYPIAPQHQLQPIPPQFEKPQQQFHPMPQQAYVQQPHDTGVGGPAQNPFVSAEPRVVVVNSASVQKLLSARVSPVSAPPSSPLPTVPKNEDT